MSGGPHLCYWEESGLIDCQELSWLPSSELQWDNNIMKWLKKSQSKIRLDEMWTSLLSVVSWVSLGTSPNPWPLTWVTFLWKSDTCCFPEGLSPELSPEECFLARSSTCHHWAWVRAQRPGAPTGDWQWLWHVVGTGSHEVQNMRNLVCQKHVGTMEEEKAEDRPDSSAPRFWTR